MEADLTDTGIELVFSDDDDDLTELAEPQSTIKKMKRLDKSDIMRSSIDAMNCSKLLLPERKVPKQEGEAALYAAARKGDTAEVKKLLKTVQCAAIPAEGGRTPLHAASLALKADTVKCLLEAAPSCIESFDREEKRTPLHCAVGALLDREESIADKDCVTEVVDVLLDEASPSIISAQDLYGRTALHIAISARQVDACTMLLKHSTPAMLRIRNKAGDTPLHLAARIGLSRSIIEDMIGISAASTPSAALPIWRRLFKKKDGRPPVQGEEKELGQEMESKLLYCSDIGDLSIPLLCIANARGEPAVPGKDAGEILFNTSRRGVALTILNSMNTQSKVNEDTNPPTAPFAFDIEAEHVDQVLDREGTTWLDVLDLMVSRSKVSYTLSAIATALGGILVIGDELTDYLVTILLFFEGKYWWGLASFAVLLVAQLTLVFLLTRMKRNKKYCHAFQWVPSSKVRLLPLMFDGIVFTRATRELWHVTNLSKTKSLEGLTIALAFLEAMTESIPQCLLQIALFRSTNRGNATLLYASIVIALLSITKALVTYIWFKCSHRSNILGIIKPVADKTPL